MISQIVKFIVYEDLVYKYYTRDDRNIRRWSQ